MTAIATKLATAQNAALIARATRDAAYSQLDADFPEPTDDTAWEAWNDAYENAACDRGLYALDDAVRAADAALIRTAREALRGHADFEASAPAFAAALGERAGWHVAFNRVRDLCMRLDPATV